MHPHGNTTRQARKRLAIVPRVSTEDQEEYGTSLDDQKAKGLLLGQLHDYMVDDRPYEEGGHIYSGDESGALPLAHRPIMRRLIADAQAHKFDAVCFTKIDRIARRLKYILEIWDALDEAGVTVLVIDPAIDTSTPIGRLIRNVLGSIAEFERDTILDRTMAGRKRKLARGEIYLPRGKDGYTYSPIDRKEGRPGRITVNDDRAAVIRRIFERRAAGVSLDLIALELTADGIPTPSGLRAWRHATIGAMIRDGAYKGEGEWGLRVSIRTENGKRSARRRPHPGGTIALRYPPIVSPELWAAANHVGQCGERHPVRTDASSFLLHGCMVRCAEHDVAMSGSSDGRGWARYRCMRLLPTGKRTTHGVPSRALDEAVWAEIDAFLLAPHRAMEAARRQAAQTEHELEALAVRKMAIQKRLLELDEETAYLLRVARQTRLAPAKLDASLAEVHEEETRLRDDLARLDAQVDLARAELPRAADIEAICREFAEGAKEATPDQKRGILEALRVRVLMHGHDYSITGIVPELTAQGSLTVHTATSSADEYAWLRKRHRLTSGRTQPAQGGQSPCNWT
jgi:site-specific DNA recombinase